MRMLDGMMAMLRSCDVPSKSGLTMLSKMSVSEVKMWFLILTHDYMDGWGSDDDDETTMTHQAVLEGIPSLQLENPSSISNFIDALE